MFAEDVGLLPDNMFTRMLEHARRRPDEFTELSRELFGAMSTGGRIGFEAVGWFNGGLFDDDETLPLGREEIEVTLKAAALDWSEIDPSIFGTLFERGLDPDKRSQLGAHYTDREKIMLLVEPVVVRPLLAEWELTKAEIGAKVERAETAKSVAARTRLRQQADRMLRTFLERLRTFAVVDPACGSGNFLYLALHALKDIEHRVQLEAEAMGFQRGFPAVGPANVKGDRGQRLRGGACPCLGVDRRDPVDAAQRFPRSARPDPEAAGDHRMPRRDPDAGRRRARVAHGGCGHREPAVPRRKAPQHPPRGGLRLAHLQRLRRPSARRGRPGLLLVREGRRAAASGEDQTSRDWCRPTRFGAERTGAHCRTRPKTARYSTPGATSRG